MIINKLRRDMQDCEVLEVVSGSHWTAVVVNNGSNTRCGLATTVSKRRNSKPNLQEYPELVGRSSKKVAQLTYQMDTRATSIGLAAINASADTSKLTFNEGHGVELIAELGKDKHVVLVGHFPFVEDLRSEVGHLDVLELLPKPGDLPVTEAPNIIPKADVLVITSMTLVNGTIDSMLSHANSDVKVIMLGPSTPLMTSLYETGINGLCGSIVEDIPNVLKGVREGVSFRKLRHYGVKLVFALNQ